MIVHLLNSAVMPKPGFYELREITAEVFAKAVRTANEKDVLRHYIGYTSTRTLVEQLTGIDLQGLRFEKTELRDGDRFLVVRLKYRPTPAEKKADTPTLSDFEFFKGSYTSR